METVQHFIDKFLPDNYNLFLDINRAEKTFSGNVAISGEALVDRISLHQKGLVISNVLLDNQSLDFIMDDANEAVHIFLPETGIMTLLVEFSGQITDNMTGIYPSYYTVDGDKKEVISTQFESHFAREAFPSVDEPEAKATFNLSVKFDAEEDDSAIVLSNMPEVNPERRKETGIWAFQTTPRMSTYLLAFALGDLQGNTAYTKNGTEVGVFSTKAHPLSNLDFALDIAVRVIDFYEEYFGVPYPIPHSYHVALPDFSAGAMENWGLVTYREVYLLVDDNSTVASRQQVALVVAHEIAHQWFGNLVTMKWWDDLWLNESFANMMEYVSVDAIEPSWGIFEDFQTTGVPLALRRDATDGVQSVHVDVNHPDEINTLFDPAIVYAKGSRLMHMLRRWLGDEDFAKGLKAYFEAHKYNNTVGRNLWDALSEASGKDVAALMASWLDQPGYPVLSVTVENNQLILRQKQFFIGEHENQERIWQIPLNSNWEGLPDILTEKEVVIDDYADLKAKNKGPLLFNTENTAHYIVNYHGRLLEELFAQFDQLDAISKLQVLQDRRLLAESGEISYASLVDLVRPLNHEKTFVVNAALQEITNGLERFVDEGTPAQEDYHRLLKTVFGESFNRLGYEAKAGESDEDELLRQLAVSNLLKANDETAVAQAHELYTTYEQDIEKIPAAIRKAVLQNEVRHFEHDGLVDHFLRAYVRSNDGSFKREIASALANTHDFASLNHILLQFKDKDVIKPQDLSTWYSFFLSHDFVQDTVWAWACENWSWIKQALGGDMSFDRFVVAPSNIFKTEKGLQAYRDFFEPQLDDLAISRSIKMGITTILARVELVSSEKEAVVAALANH